MVIEFVVKQGGLNLLQYINLQLSLFQNIIMTCVIRVWRVWTMESHSATPSLLIWSLQKSVTSIMLVGQTRSMARLSPLVCEV